MDKLPGDAGILEGFGLDDLDENSVEEYRASFATTKPKHPWHALSQKALLEQLGCWKKNRDSGNYGLTLAGLLMFGKHEAITQAAAASNYLVDYRDYRKQAPGGSWSDRLFPDGTWEANLFQFWQRSWSLLTKELNVRRPSKEARRVDQTIVHLALRKTVVNALVHSDYSVAGGIVLERYPERIVMENPGTLMISQEQMRRGGVSFCRNKLLQRMFMLIGGCDQAGAGYGRILEGARAQQWPEPRLTSQAQPARIRLVFHCPCR